MTEEQLKEEFLLVGKIIQHLIRHAPPSMQSHALQKQTTTGMIGSPPLEIMRTSLLWNASLYHLSL
jgi:hypothetical protein